MKNQETGWWVEKNKEPRIPTRIDRLMKSVGMIEQNTELQKQIAKDIHFIAKALKVWIGLMVAGLVIWIGYLIFVFG